MLDGIKMFISKLGNDAMVYQASIWDPLAISRASWTKNLRNSTKLELEVD